MAHVKLTALVTTALFIIAAGTVSRAWAMYFMAGVLITLPAASLLVAWFSLRGLRVERILPPAVWARIANPMRLRIRSTGSWPRLGLMVGEADETLRQGCPMHPARAGSVAMAPAPEAEWGADRPVSGWAVIDLPAGGEATVEYPVIPPRRGVYRLDRVLASAHDPMGLFMLSRPIPAPAEMVVYPLPRVSGTLAITGADLTGRAEAETSRARGTGSDPDGVRQYIPGDPLRRMHWKTLARTGRLHVIEFEEPRSLSLTIVLDCYVGGVSSPSAESNFEQLVDAAASFADEATKQGVPIALLHTGPDAAEPVRQSGPEQLLTIMDTLARVTAAGDLPLADAVAAHFAFLASAGTVVLLTGEPDPALGEAIAMLRSAGTRAAVVWSDREAFIRRRSVAALVRDGATRQAAFVRSVAGGGGVLYCTEEGADHRLRLVPIADLGDARE